MDWLWAFNMVVAAFILGLVAFVHVVHYPLFRRIDAPAWQAYHAEHIHRTTRIVAPVMLFDAIAAGCWAWLSGSATSWLALACVALAWVITFAGAVPAHHRLAERFDHALHRRLLRCNRARLIAWTGRLVMLVVS